jgi:cobalt-zinc-cadmium efflux system membrane fusion protein
MTIADLSTLWVTTNIPEAYIRHCRIGGGVQVELTAFPGETFTGRVTQIADTLDPQMRTVKVRAELNNPQGRFLPEMYGQVHYLDGQHLAPVVNSASVVQFDGKSYVFIEQSPGTFARREVIAGRRFGEKLIIMSGLKSGDRIATEGAIYLREMTQ